MWSIGYFASSVGLDEHRIREYVKYQEKQDKGQALLVSEARRDSIEKVMKNNKILDIDI